MCITKQHTVQLVDFGLARRTPHSTLMGTRCGTDPYWAPEQQKGDNYGRKIDLWTLGIIMYQRWEEVKSCCDWRVLTYYFFVHI